MSHSLVCSTSLPLISLINIFKLFHTLRTVDQIHQELFGEILGNAENRTRVFGHLVFCFLQKIISNCPSARGKIACHEARLFFLNKSFNK